MGDRQPYRCGEVETLHRLSENLRRVQIRIALVWWPSLIVLITAGDVRDSHPTDLHTLYMQAEQKVGLA